MYIIKKPLNNVINYQGLNFLDLSAVHIRIEDPAGLLYSMARVVSCIIFVKNTRAIK